MELLDLLNRGRRSCVVPYLLLNSIHRRRAVAAFAKLTKVAPFSPPPAKQHLVILSAAEWGSRQGGDRPAKDSTIVVVDTAIIYQINRSYNDHPSCLLLLLRGRGRAVDGHFPDTIPLDQVGFDPNNHRHPLAH